MQEVIEFNGSRYARYTCAERESDRKYFKDHGRLLHRDVWEFHNGPIADGYEIHHSDGDASNNSIENLECLTKREHARRHLGCTEAMQENLERIRPLTKAWHGSDSGKDWHSKHAKQIWSRRESYCMECQQCGAEYTTKTMGKSKYCSPKCRARAFRKRHIRKAD